MWLYICFGLFIAVFNCKNWWAVKVIHFLMKANGLLKGLKVKHNAQKQFLTPFQQLKRELKTFFWVCKLSSPKKKYHHLICNQNHEIGIQYSTIWLSHTFYTLSQKMKFFPLIVVEIPKKFFFGILHVLGVFYGEFPIVIFTSGWKNEKLTKLYPHFNS